MGKPVICFGNSNLNEFVTESKIGMVAEKQEDIQLAVIAINKNYQEFSRNALKIFQSKFNVLNYKNSFKSFLELQ